MAYEIMSRMHKHSPGAPHIHDPAALHNHFPSALHNHNPAALHNHYPAALHDHYPGALHNHDPATTNTSWWEDKTPHTLVPRKTQKPGLTSKRPHQAYPEKSCWKTVRRTDAYHQDRVRTWSTQVLHLTRRQLGSARVGNTAKQHAQTTNPYCAKPTVFVLVICRAINMPGEAILHHCFTQVFCINVLVQGPES